MSQTLESPSPLAFEAWTNAEPDAPASNSFDYRPVPVLAVVAFVLGLASVIAVLGLFGIFLACISLILGVLSILKIRRAGGTLGGQTLATVGTMLAAFFFVSGTAWQVYAFRTEVPPEFQRTSFVREISAKKFGSEDGRLKLHPDVEALVGKPLFLKGFMYPTGQQEGLGGFLMLKDSGQCCFGGKPALTDMMGVIMQDGETVDYDSGRVSIGGTFRVNENFTGQDSLEPLYLLEAKFFSKSRTAF